MFFKFNRFFRCNSLLVWLGIESLLSHLANLDFNCHVVQLLRETDSSLSNVWLPQMSSSLPLLFMITTIVRMF